MCGIFGCIGNEEVAPILLEGLKRLEYRGYDSAGIATVDSCIQMKKDVGRIGEIHNRLNFLDLSGKIGIAHTRWATHGGVTKENAHPHTSNNGKIVVAHNGIIENYQEIKKFLQENDFNFFSETDTEVVPNLIEFEMRGGKSFEESCKSAFKKLEGNFALLVMHEDENGIVASRKGSPLVIGVADDAVFAASDIPAFLEHTKRVMYLHDHDMVFMGNGLKVFNFQQDEYVERPIDTIDWDVEQAKKGDFNHFMMKEISEQVETVQKAVQQDKEIVEWVAREIRNASGVFLIGCGSSYHACLSASYIFSKIAKFHVNVVLGSEFSNYEDFLNEKSLVIAVSQSGETADVLEAVKSAKRKRSKVISIVNVMGS
jgi:glucosamine--fructose-6-phosphate aminotransferase (isomerizing)